MICAEKEIFTAAGDQVAVGVAAVPWLALRDALPARNQRRPETALSHVARKSYIINNSHLIPSYF